MNLTYEEFKQLEAEFNGRHPDWIHGPIVPGPVEFARIRNMWFKLLNRQNGRDFDNVVVDGEHRAVGYLRKYAPLDKGFKRVLAVGVGTGAEVVCMREAGYECDGITLGPKNVAFAKEVFGVDLHYLDAHSASATLGIGCYDTVVALQTLEHSCAPLMLLIEFARLLRPGGKVIVETPNSVEWTMGRELHHCICPTPRQMEGLLLKAGFLDVKTGVAEFLCVVDGNNCNYERAAADDCEDTVLGIGTRWTPERAEEVEPITRELTGE